MMQGDPDEEENALASGILDEATKESFLVAANKFHELASNDADFVDQTNKLQELVLSISVKTKKLEREKKNCKQLQDTDLQAFFT